MGLEPFDLHPADPGALNATADDLTASARGALDHERATLAAFFPALASWSGIASEELRAAPDDVRSAALRTTVDLSWGGSVIRYWATQVSRFNTTVATLRAQVSLIEVLPFGDDREALQSMRRQWHEAHEHHIVAGGQTVAAMLAEGPTSANIELLRQEDVLPRGLDRVIPALWEELVPPTTDRIRLLDLNIGMGYENEEGNPRGTEPIDIGRIAWQIWRSGADVATLQEVWGLPSILGNPRMRGRLERELKRLTGDDWTLHFQEATLTTNRETGADGVPYGNLIAVRNGSGVVSSRVVLDEQISTEANEPRRMLGVNVTTEGGGTVNVYTAHASTDSQAGSSEAEQVRQIVRVGSLAGDDGVPSIVTGDFNQAPQRGPDAEDAGLALTDLIESGYTDAGAAVGPTLGSGRIDLVLTEGVAPGEPDRVEGDPERFGGDGTGSVLTDHDGIALDIEVPADR